MVFDRNDNKKVAVLLGAGSMGTAILRRVCAGKTLTGTNLLVDGGTIAALKNKKFQLGR
ncbi:MAG: hypothetical protein IJ696_02165 [Ruminococcus sp.]|nr:hypothetical protein [Ruminococcus sp.]